MQIGIQLSINCLARLSALAQLSKQFDERRQIGIAMTGPRAPRNWTAAEGNVEAAEELVRLRPDVRVLYVSGYMEDEVVRHGVSTAQVAFLHKPFGPAELARKVRYLLDVR